MSVFTVTLFGPLIPDHQFSMERYGAELAQAMSSHSHEVAVLNFNLPGTFSRAATQQRGLRRVGSLLDRFVAYPVAALLMRSQVNHLIDHSYSHLALFTNPRRTVVTFHDAMMSKLANREVPTESLPRLATIGQRIRLRSLGGVSRVITDSQASRTDLLRFTDYPEESIRVVPLGVSDRFRPVQSAGDETSDHGVSRTIRLLHVGHCGPYKNIQGILRALPFIKSRLGCPVTFLKAGLPFTRAQLDLIAQLGLQETVHHLGVVPDSELPALYRNSDVLLLPSLHEGFGLPLLEAMACGTPVIASTAGALPETAGKAALFVDPLDLQGLADAVFRIAGNPALRAELRRRGLERARQFTWQRTASATLAVYREVASEAGVG